MATKRPSLCRRDEMQPFKDYQASWIQRTTRALHLSLGLRDSRNKGLSEECVQERCGLFLGLLYILFQHATGFHAPAIQIALGTIALDRPDGAGMPGMRIALGRVVYREGILAVVGCRDWSRQVFVHSLMITGSSPLLAGYPKNAKADFRRESVHCAKTLVIGEVARYRPNGSGLGSKALSISRITTRNFSPSI